MGRPPTHLDSHQHVHREEPTRIALMRLSKRLAVPVRGLTPGIGYLGFHGKDHEGTSLPEEIGVEALVRIIEGLPPGVSELGCHPAAADDHPSAYGSGETSGGRDALRPQGRGRDRSLRGGSTLIRRARGGRRRPASTRLGRATVVSVGATLWAASVGSEGERRKAQPPRVDSDHHPRRYE